MRILLAGWSCSIFFEYGGLDTFLLNLSESLKNMGHEVTILGCHPDPRMRGKVGKRNGVKGIVACTVTDLQEKNIYQIYRDVMEYATLVSDYDYIIVNDFHIAPPLVMMANTYEVPLVYYMHIYSGNAWDLASIIDAPVVATNSMLMKEMIDSILHHVKNVAEPRSDDGGARVVYPATPRLPEPDPDYARRIRESFPLRVDFDYIIHVHARAGQPNKNVEIIHEIVRRLNKRGLKVVGLVTGRGWEPKTVPEDRIVYFGEIPWDKLPSWYHTADIFLMPSDFEPFGLVTLEAIKSGTVAVISKKSGVYEYLTELIGDTPAFDPHNPKEATDVIETLLRDPEQRHTIWKRQYQAIQYRTWYHVAQEILQLRKQ